MGCAIWNNYIAGAKLAQNYVMGMQGLNGGICLLCFDESR